MFPNGNNSPEIDAAVRQAMMAFAYQIQRALRLRSAYLKWLLRHSGQGYPTLTAEALEGVSGYLMDHLASLGVGGVGGASTPAAPPTLGQDVTGSDLGGQSARNAG